MKKKPFKSSLLYSPIFFPYYQRAQNQPKYHILFHKNGSLRNFYLMTLLNVCLFGPKYLFNAIWNLRLDKMTHDCKGIGPQFFFSDDFSLKSYFSLDWIGPGDCFFYRFDLFLLSLHSKQPVLTKVVRTFGPFSKVWFIKARHQHLVILDPLF